MPLSPEMQNRLNQLNARETEQARQTHRFGQLIPAENRGLHSIGLQPVNANNSNPNPPNALANPTAPQAEEEEAPFDWMGSPGAQFRLQYGLDQVQNSLTGRGMSLSGRAQKELERFRQNYATGEFNNEFSRNATLAGLSPPALTDLNALQGNFASNAGNLVMNQGQINANSAYNNANIFSNALNNFAYGYGMYGSQG